MIRGLRKRCEQLSRGGAARYVNGISILFGILNYSPPPLFQAQLWPVLLGRLLLFLPFLHPFPLRRGGPVLLLLLPGKEGQRSHADRQGELTFVSSSGRSNFLLQFQYLTAYGEAALTLLLLPYSNYSMMHNSAILLFIPSAVPPCRVLPHPLGGLDRGLAAPVLPAAFAAARRRRRRRRQPSGVVRGRRTAQVKRTNF